MPLPDSSAYTFSWYAVPTLLVAGILLAIGGFVLKQNLKSQINQSFFLLCIALFIWLTGYSAIYSLDREDIALPIYRFYTFLGVSFIGFSVYLFSVLWLQLWKQQKYFVIFSLLLTASFYVAAWTTNLVVPSIDQYFWGLYSHYGPLGVVFFATFVIFFFIAFFNFMYRLRNPIPSVQKSQIKAVLFSFCVALTGAIDFVPKMAHIPIYPFGYISALLWILIMAYAIVKYKVMDIQTAIHKTLLWLTTSVVFLAPIALASYFVWDWLSGLSAAWFSLLVFCFIVAFIPYVRFVQPYIDQWFERRTWNLNQVIKQFNDELIHLKTIEDLSSHILQTIKKTIYPQDLNLLLWDEGGKESLLFTNDLKALKYDVSQHHDFFRFLESYDTVILADYVEIDPRLEQIRQQARRYFSETKGEVCVPIVLNEKLIGAINLHSKVNLKSYSRDDIRFLSDLRGSATIAISNSLRLIAMQASLRRWNEELEKQVNERTKELKEAQGKLIQAEKLATIGTLAGGVAHEINNPLAAILTNAQMLLSEKLDPGSMESLQLIEEAAERCRIIVQKLMKYSRKSSPGESFDLVDLNEAVEQTIALLQYQLEQDNVKLVKKLSASGGVLGNANELAQVLTNLILNARDALRNKQNAQIEIRTFDRDSKTIVEVEDNGDGIPAEIVSKIFDPFFTTKDVGKGTGLGLSIVQGIIEKHGAQIDVKSKIGSGTTMSVAFLKQNMKSKDAKAESGKR